MSVFGVEYHRVNPMLLAQGPGRYNLLVSEVVLQQVGDIDQVAAVGPRNVPKTPRAAITARNSSVSKYSDARSATAIGPQRSRRNMSFLPSLRIARPVCSMLHKSPRLGWSMSGGVVANASPMTLA